jgi:hypothetical protein
MFRREKALVFLRCEMTRMAHCVDCAMAAKCPKLGAKLKSPMRAQKTLVTDAVEKLGFYGCGLCIA